MEPSINNVELGKRIAQLRNIKSLTQEELASRIAISRPSLVQIEKGSRNIKVTELKALSSPNRSADRQGVALVPLLETQPSAVNRLRVVSAFQSH